MQQLLDTIVRYAEANDAVSALILIGSQARDARKADAFSDIDLLLIVQDPEPFIRSDAWLQDISGVHISFTEHTIDGQIERRVLLDGAQDVDFVIIGEQAAAQALERGEAANILRRGYKVLVNKAHFPLPPPVPPAAFVPAEEAEFQNTVHDFWFHTVWTAKKLLRGEVWAAKFCADGYMKYKLLWMIEQHEHAVRRSGCDTWYGGRFIDSWVDESIRRELETAFAHYTREDIAAALRITMQLFRRLATETADIQGFAYPTHADEYATQWVQEHLEALLRPGKAKGGGV